MQGSIIAEFIEELVIDQLSDSVIESAKRVILDILGVGLAGSKQNINKIFNKVFMSLLKEPREAIIWGHAVRTSCMEAALFNSVASSCLDADDGHRGALGHPGATIVPSAIAVSERINATGRELIEAIVVGYEVGIRAGAFLNRNHDKIFYGSGTWGTIGAAAASAKLLRLNHEQCLSALGLAELNAPLANFMNWVRLRQPLPQMKEAIGWGAFTGVTSALLAKEGLRGTFSLPEQKNADIMIQDLNKNFEITKIYFKIHSSCRWTHPTIDGIIDAMKNHKLDNDKIKEIVVATHHKASYLDNKKPIWSEAAQYSIPYTMAAAIINKKVGPVQMSENALNDRNVLELAGRITVKWDQKLDKAFPEATSSSILITTIDGNKITISPKKHTKGDYQEPFNWSDLKGKFCNYTKNIISVKQMEKIIEIIESLECLDKINQLTELLVPGNDI